MYYLDDIHFHGGIMHMHTFIKANETFHWPAQDRIEHCFKAQQFMQSRILT